MMLTTAQTGAGNNGAAQQAAMDRFRQLARHDVGHGHGESSTLDTLPIVFDRAGVFYELSLNQALLAKKIAGQPRDQVRRTILFS